MFCRLSLPKSMEHEFSLPVMYKGEEVDLEGKWILAGYVSKFHVLIKGQEVVFEQDDEQNYRALQYEPDANKEPLETELIQAVIVSLEQLKA